MQGKKKKALVIINPIQKSDASNGGNLLLIYIPVNPLKKKKGFRKVEDFLCKTTLLDSYWAHTYV